jgi:hypothetical protein
MSPFGGRTTWCKNGPGDGRCTRGSRTPYRPYSPLPPRLWPFHPGSMGDRRGGHLLVRPGCELGFTPGAVLGAASSVHCPLPTAHCPQSGFVVKRRRPGGRPALSRSHLTWLRAPMPTLGQKLVCGRHRIALSFPAIVSLKLASPAPPRPHFDLSKSIHRLPGCPPRPYSMQHLIPHS